MFDKMPQPEAKLWIFEDASALAREAARRFTAAAGRSVEAGAILRVALSGGQTPRETYRTMASEPYRFSVHWPSVELFWGDERFVPHDHLDSNFRAAREALLDAVDIPSSQVHPIPTGVDPEAAAAAYEATLRRAFGAGPQEVPRFDLVFLGLGSDGHTASIFPSAPLPTRAGALVAATARPGDPVPRITLTPLILSAARQVVFLVCGASKADALERALRATNPDPAVPATLVNPAEGNVVWLADRAAAAGVVAGEAPPEVERVHT